MYTHIYITIILLLISAVPFVYISSFQSTGYKSEVSESELKKYLKMSDMKQRTYLINKYLKGVDIPVGYTIAFKGFSADMTCRGFKYREGETYSIKINPITCTVGFHACLIPRDVATYYHKSNDVYHIVFLKGIDRYYGVDSKKCAKIIKIGPRIPRQFIV